MRLLKMATQWLWMSACVLSTQLYAQIPQTGQYEGQYKITMRAYPTGAILGHGVEFATWRWDFAQRTVEIEGTTLTVGFNYALHDVGDQDKQGDLLYFTENEDGTITLDYSLQIYHPGLGNPMALTSSRMHLVQQGDKLTITTLDWEKNGEQDEIPGTQIPNVFPLTIEPDLIGTAIKLGADSNQDGLLDEYALLLGLDPSQVDSDGDGQTDITELGDDVSKPLDSDGDSVIDALEPGFAAFDNTLLYGLKSHSGTQLQFSVSEGWQFKGATVDSMLHKVDPLQSTQDIGVNDPSLGQAGLEYEHGRVALTIRSTQAASSLGHITMRFTQALPEKPLLYILVANGEHSQYRLLEQQYWWQEDQSSLTIAVSDGGAYDLDGLTDDQLSISIALTENTLGDVSVKEAHNGGSLYWLLGVFMLLALKRKSH